MTALAAGTRIGAGYEIVSQLSEGGMGTVYKARQVSLSRDVVVKVLNPEFIQQDEFVQRFWREALAAARLNHPNIVQVYDQGRHADRPYIVMEYVPGKSVAELIDHQGCIGVGPGLSILIQAAAGLSAAHAASIIHRDIKPGNLLVTPAGQVKIADFGIAKVYGEDATCLTQSDCLIGTIQYMSPEQFDGRPVDARSDIYSLGITFYHMLVGCRPFDDRNTLQLISRQMTERPVPAHKKNALVPEEVSRLIEKMVEKDPAARFSSCRALEKSARQVQKALGLEPRDPESVMTEMAVPKPPPAGAARLRGLLPVLVTGGLLLAAAVLGWWLSRRLG